MFGDIIHVDAAEPFSGEDIGGFTANTAAAVSKAANVETIKIFELGHYDAEHGTRAFDLNWFPLARVEQIIDGPNARTLTRFFLQDSRSSAPAIFGFRPSGGLAPHDAVPFVGGG